MHLFKLLSIVALPFAHSLQITPKQNVPDNASPAIDPQFLGFGIEAASVPDYTGNKSHPNEFSLNMFKSITERARAPVPIRLGGTSMDHSIYDPNQKKAIDFPQGEKLGHRSNMTIGTSWLDSLSMVSNPKWILMVPLARRNLSNAIEFARAGLKAMSPGSYEAIEIGNEVNLYPGGARPKGYSLNNLVGEWSTYADALQSNLSIPKGPNFWACSFSSTTKWNVQDAWSDGLSKEAAKIKGVSEHYYQTVGSATLEETMLNHTNTTAASHRFQSPASFLRNLKSGSILFILGEVGSALGQGHKNYKLQDSLGSAIWTADWMLYAMSIGVSRVNMQLISEGTISAWLPIVNKVGGTQQPAQVLGNWYGNVMIADILGSGKGKKIQVAEMNNLSGADMAGYSIYHDGTLTQIALFNEHLWVKGDGKRPEQNVALSGLGGCDKLKVQRLTGDSGTALKNISWAGQRWSAERKGVPQKVGQESTIVESKNGCFDITVQATEGVLISLL